MAHEFEAAQPADEMALRRLVMRYAHCCDRRDGDGFGALFAKDAVLEGPGFRFSTPRQIGGVPLLLNQFEKTYHTLQNLLFETSGDRATGEAYSMAHHLTRRPDGKCDDLVMYITYRDRYLREGADWRFEHRQVVMEFTESRVVENAGERGG